MWGCAPAKYEPNRSSGSAEEVVKMFFTIILMTAILNFGS